MGAVCPCFLRPRGLTRGARKRAAQPGNPNASQKSKGSWRCALSQTCARQWQTSKERGSRPNRTARRGGERRSPPPSPALAGSAASWLKHPNPNVCHPTVKCQEEGNNLG